MDFFNRRDAGAREDSQALLRGNDGRLSWAGFHPALSYVKYWLSVSPNFQREYLNTTHELFIGLVVNEGTGGEFAPSKKRLLFRRQSDYRLPGLAPDRVASLIASGLIKFLLKHPNPRYVRGMYDLPESRPKPGSEEISVWEAKHSQLYRTLLAHQLKINGIPIAAYRADPALYLDLGSFDAPKDTQY